MRTIKKGATSQSLYFDVLDSTSTTGGRKTGLAYNTSSLVAYYVRSQNTATAITLATLAAANTAWSSGGFKEVDATNMPGIYRLDVPDAAFAAGAGDSVAIVIKGATGMVQASCDVQLVAWDPQDTVRAGLTALPNAAAEAAGGLYTRGTGAGQINQDANGRVDANAKAWAGTAATLTSGLPDVNMKTITAGIIAAASFAANALDAVWSTTTRLLTAGTNIALAKGTGVTGFTDLDASGVRAAIGMASANLDTQIATLSTSADIAALQSHGDGAWGTATGFSTLGATDVTDAVWDVQLTDHVDSGTAGQTLFYAAQGANSADSKASNIYGDTQAIRGLTDTLVNTGGKLWVLDSDGNALATASDIQNGLASQSSVDALPAATDNAAAVLAATYEGSENVQDFLRLARAVLFGKANALNGTTTHFRDAADAKNRVTATVDPDAGTRVPTALDAT